MSDCKVPDYRTGRRGRHWTHALRAAQRTGAVIVTDDTGQLVTYAPDRTGPGRFRPSTTPAGVRYDSHDVHPEW
ncbi:hypothetical protein OG304_37665 [Streptomyces sp. NBC_00160]|uniref:hypothetical protein n=1 Tax=Streptomyces sp. NBC_00160 TaxID=2903628 RepID=UPI00224E4DC3|nr:hypothetical protein [Streptomyces sp. NBC_00160]MCX5309100.1 hypothetical protein [Streptomyces sp. NBC_00160]